MLVRLSPAQRDLLLGPLHPEQHPVCGSHTLRTALATAALRDQYYEVDMTAEMVEAASLLFRLACASGGPHRQESRTFDAAYILGPRDQTHRTRLLSALTDGAEIREVTALRRAVHRPRHDDDPQPWIIEDAAHDGQLRLPDDDVHPIWPLKPVLVISDSPDDDPVGLLPCRVPLHRLPPPALSSVEYRLAPLVLLDDRSYAAFRQRRMPRRRGLVVVCADPDDGTVYPRAAAIGADAVMAAGQDLGWLHVRLHDATECRYLPLDELLPDDTCEPPPCGS
ncbi:hypothetical protein ACIRPJ_33160 [Streptomyces asoensis]|uniref:hypothetical protein n=1 Tax=Streptomyces asoensis TaxID=249586 RepID=UPI0019916773|nr:hypothetical protein [Streptomyces asoensis]GGQ97318.1 hypothetical protein GCM10010496_72780 [Streptomyces asoensis]